MISHLLEKLEFIIVPVANPDGYYVSVMNTKFTICLSSCNDHIILTKGSFSVADLGRVSQVSFLAQEPVQAERDELHGGRLE